MSKAKEVKDRMEEEAQGIRDLFVQLKREFLARDAIRNPEGWKLPPERECGEQWFLRRWA